MQSKDLTKSSLEETVTLTVIAKQFRGNCYLQPSPDYNASVNQAKKLLQRGKIVKLIINVQGPKSIENPVTDQLFQRLVEELQDWAKVRQTSELKARQMIVQLFPHREQNLGTETPQATSTTDSYSPLEKTVTLEATVKRFRGNFYLQQSYRHYTSLRQAKKLLQQGNSVKLAVSFQFQSQKNLVTILADQLFDRLVDEFQDWATVKQISELNDCQMFIELSPSENNSLVNLSS
jgi:translation initiation factor IF-3